MVSKPTTAQTSVAGEITQDKSQKDSGISPKRKEEKPEEGTKPAEEDI